MVNTDQIDNEASPLTAGRLYRKASVLWFAFLLRARRCAAGAETITAQDRSSRRRLEGHCVGLATLIASDLEALTLSARSPGAAKIIATRVAARLATFGVGQVLLPIVLLFSLSKRKCFSALHASDFNIWHDYFLRESSIE